MISNKSAAASDWADLGSGPGRLEALKSYWHCTWAVGEMEGRKLRHDPTELLTRAIQPTLWLVVFGEAMARLKAIPTGPVSYLTFMTPVSWRSP